MTRVSESADWSESCAVTEVAAQQSALAETDGLYSRAVLENGFVSAIGEYVDPSARFFRNGNLPLVGLETISTSTHVTEAVWDEWEAQDAKISASCDLGFSFGVVQLVPDPSNADNSTHASYYRIWRRSADAGWRVVVDVLIPFVATPE